MSSHKPDPDPVAAKHKKPPFDLIKRGEKAPTPAGTLTFIGLRALDIPLQYLLLRASPSGLGARLLGLLGVASVWSSSSSSSPQSLLLHTGIAWLDDNLDVAGAVLLCMAAAAAAKQVFWQTRVSAESFPPQAAAAVSAYNSAVNAGNALLLAAAATTALRSTPTVHLNLGGGVMILPACVPVGALLFVAGMALETAAEIQRRDFKRDVARNEGKLCTRGLWRALRVRHPNYLGYAMWRAGYAMAAGGWVAGLAMGLLQGWDLGTRAAEVLSQYCGDRYGAQWERYCEEVPWRIVPGVY
ncbi:hypothetical protein GGR56DRAFT_616634 [Xylariaceae sp. FL0804]|nr:hypothetical protein GGR56DRAFT_616634 [Xylariaceae sp. FL0804]